MSAHDFAREHRDCSEALGAYVLLALPPAEAELVQRHLTTCGRCREEAGAFQLAVDALPGTAPPMRAPPELKDRIMAVVGAEAELLAAAGSGADRPDSERGRRRFALPLRRPALAAAAAAGLATAAVLGFVVRGGSDEKPARTVAAQLLGVGVPAKAHAAVRVSGERGSLLVKNLPDPPRDRVYEVWVSRPGQAPVPAGATFTLRTGEVDIPHSMRGVNAVMVTAERHGGSQVPTSSPIVVARTA
jgi:anti-sigma-K factor RskA